MKPKNRNRDIGAKVCGCINHDYYCTLSPSKTISLRCRAYFQRRREYQELLARHLVNRQISYICTKCLDYGRRKVAERSTTANSSLNNGDDYDAAHIISDLSNTTDTLTVDECSEILTHDNESNVPEENTMAVDTDSADETSGTRMVADENVLDHADTHNDSLEQSDEPDPDGNPADLSYHVKKLTMRIKELRTWGQLNDDLKDSLCELSLVMGALIRKDLDNERFEMAHQCRDFSSLISIKPREWYKQRNVLLTSFLHGCTGVSPETEKKKKLNSAIHAVEQIMYTKNNNIVTPFSLQRNLIIYMVSHSKGITSICGSWEPSGSYTKINEILNSPSPPLTITGCNDIAVTFDNEQKVGRHSGRIREGSKQSISIITTVAVIEPRPTSQYQFLPYKRIDLDSAAIIKSVNSMESQYLETMRIYRHKFVDEIINVVYDEQIQNDVDFIIDAVDIATMNEGSYVCSCGHLEDSLFEVCSKCGINTSFFDHGYDKYFRSMSMHSSTPAVSNADPILVNPIGIESVTKVLQEIKHQAISNSNGRQCVVVTCDGVPYTHASEIQDEQLECLTCHKLLKKVEKEEHSNLHDDRDTQYARPFKELLIRPGAGHIELNMGRKLLSFLWVPLLSELADLFGFRTPKAKLVFKSGVDHHRTREVLECVLFALAKELVLPYVLHSIRAKETPSASGYLLWYDENVYSQNYSFTYHVTFSYLLSFHMFNEGIRKNNSENIMAARTVFHPLFFVGYHPMYKKLHLRDLIERTSYPNEIGDYLKRTESFSKSGKLNGGQGADFIHEEVNKEIKSFLPKAGVPSKKTWVQIIRKIDELKKMKSTLLVNSDVNCNVGKKRPKKFHHEIIMVRRVLRKCGFLSNYDSSNKSLTSLNGDILDYSLCDFNFVIKENYKSYKEEYQLNGEFGSKKPTPVFITNEERAE